MIDTVCFNLSLHFQLFRQFDWRSTQRASHWSRESPQPPGQGDRRLDLRVADPDLNPIN